MSLRRPLESKVHLPQSQEAPRARRDHVPDSYPRTPEAGRWDDGGSGSGPALLWLALGLRACQGRTASSEDGWPGAPHCPRSVPPPLRLGRSPDLAPGLGARAATPATRRAPRPSFQSLGISLPHFRAHGAADATSRPYFSRGG